MRLQRLGLAAVLALLSACDAAPPASGAAKASAASEPDLTQGFVWLTVAGDHCNLEGKELRTKAELVAGLKQVTRKDAIAVQVAVSMQDKNAAAQSDAMLRVVREAFLEAQMKPVGMVRNEVF